jgi:hypothetical protein
MDKNVRAQIQHLCESLDPFCHKFILRLKGVGSEASAGPGWTAAGQI